MYGVLSSYYDLSFPIRLGILIGILVVLASVIQLATRGRKKRWKEYGFWVLVGIAGSAYAVVNDLITSRISPEYFMLGKGLVDTDTSLVVQVMGLAFEAGFVAGMVIGGVFLLANNPKPDRPALPYRRLAWYLLWPVAGAVVVALALAVVPDLDVLGYRRGLERALSEEAAGDFLLVNWIHLGHYVGALIGTVLGAALIRTTGRSETEVG